MAHKKEVALGYADAPGRLYQLEVVEPLNYVDSQEDDYASGTVTSNDLPHPTADFVNQTLGFDKPEKNTIFCWKLPKNMGTTDVTV